VKSYRPWLLAIILIALAVRLHHLTYHSLWFDEAISVHWAKQPVPKILEVGFTLVEDRLPPLYYVLLKGWIALLGLSETSVRSLSVLMGTLLVPVVARLAADLFNRRVALSAAGLVALNPFLVWYSQEARMYAQAVLFGVLAVWAGVRMSVLLAPLPPGRGTLLPVAQRGAGGKGLFYALLFVLCAVAGLYSHLYTAFLLPALGVWLVAVYPCRWRVWLFFVGCGVLIALAFAPLGMATWRFSGEAPPGDPWSNLGGRAWWLLQAFTLWKAPASPMLQFALPAAVIFFALCACAKNARAGPKGRKGIMLTILLLVAPFGIATVLLWRNHLAFFGERYFIVMVPWLLLLAGAGAVYVGDWLGWHGIPSLLLLVLSALPLPGQWSIPAAKEAWRQSAAYLAAHARPNDAILIHPDWVRYPFQFYYQGPGQTYAAFSTVTPETNLDGPLQGVVGEHPVIWLVESHLEGPDPGRRVEQWFAARYPLVTALYPPGVTLKAYAPGYQLETLPPSATPTEFEFDNGLRLMGYEAAEEVSATDALFHPPSGWLHVTLYWAAARPITATTVPYVHLVGPEGVWGANLERANDALVLYPPTQWLPGRLIRHDVDVNLNPLTPPGRHHLVVGIKEREGQYGLGEIEVR
jgi:4-amino-4-deoxy-L-arabinose transferase-like glycosyltransferase